MIDKGTFQVSQVVLGCMRMSRMDIAQAEGLVMAAMEAGITMFDHADIYGGGGSETLFGKVLARNPGLREQMVIQSKCSIRNHMYDASKEHILASVDGILTRLGVERLDALLLHRPDALVEPEEVAEAFEALATSGKVRAFGVSNHNSMQTALLQKWVKQPILFNQLQLSLMHTGMIDEGIHVNMRVDAGLGRDGSVLDYCRLHDITVQAWSPMQYGFFEGVFVGNSKFPAVNEKLEELAGLYGVTPSAIAIAWILRHPAGIQAILGTTNASRVREMAKGADVRLTRQEWYGLYLAAGNTLP